MQVFYFLAGALMLLFGRPLYWALVAVLGFAIGYDLVRDLAVAESQILQVLIAVGAGVLAAGLAVVFQWIAFGLVGFLSGSYLVQAAFEHYEWATDHETIWFFVGGVIGAIIAIQLVDWAVIVLSALAGAAMITGQIELEQQIRLLVLLGLTAVGVIFQRKQLKDRGHEIRRRR